MGIAIPNIARMVEVNGGIPGLEGMEPWAGWLAIALLINYPKPLLANSDVLESIREMENWAAQQCNPNFEIRDPQST